METPKQRYECRNCESILTIEKSQDIEDFKCCSEPKRVLLSTEFTEEEYEETNLKKLHTIYKKYLHVEDTDRIDIILAAVLSARKEGIPIWLIIVGASGDMKSVQLNSIRDDNIFVLHNLTSKTLVNGYKNKKEHPDLAPMLHEKVIIIPDMAQILKLPPNEKGELWGQLRDLYDGFAGKMSGQGSMAKYEGLKVTMIAASTPAIDSQILVHQDLGTRELIYRTKGNNNKERAMQKSIENEEYEEEMKNELRKITKDFLRKIEINSIKINEEILEEIKRIAIYISHMRATADFDTYSNELRNYVYPEEPTRIIKQLKRLYICLKCLEEDYPDLTALRILWHIAKSSAFPIRINIYEFLSKQQTEFSTSQIAEYLKIGKGTAKRECLVLEAMNIISCRRQETTYPDKFYEYWKIRENHKIRESKFLIPSNNI